VDALTSGPGHCRCGSPDWSDQVTYNLYGRLWERFLDEHPAPLLGGRTAVDRFVAIEEEIDANQRLSVTRLAELRASALSHCTKNV
jgi:hypothetical protein